MTHTGPDGVWRLDLIPYTAYESQLADCSYYEVYEQGTPPTQTTIRVPEAPAHEELWMRDLIFDPAPCTTPGGWSPINRLSRLQDVDAHSLALAKPGDFLILQPNGKWGAARGPMPLTVSWTPDPADLLSIRVSVTGFGGAGARLGFGDGSPEQTVYTNTPVVHAYKKYGTYIVTATDVAWPAFGGKAKVTVKDHFPRASGFLDGDDAWRLLMWLMEPADGTEFSIEWGDGTSGQLVSSEILVPPRLRIAHQYTQAGVYETVVTDLSTRRQTRRDVEIGDIGVMVTFDEEKLPRTTWQWMATGAVWQCDFEGFPLQTGVVPASGIVGVVPPNPVDAGDYTVQIHEVLDSQERRHGRRQVVVPTQWDWRMNVAMTWRGAGDPPNTQTVTVAPRGARARCTVEWGDGSASDVVDPGSLVSHQYTLPAPNTGWRLRITETGLADPRTFSRMLGEPRHVGTPVLSARTSGAVDLNVAGVDQLYNDDWYQVTWGDGTTDEIAAMGLWYPANHTYIDVGTYTITLDGPGMAKPITRTIEVVHYPSPILKVTPYPDDPDHRRVSILVDNIESGGPCVVDYGDGNPPRACRQKEAFTHYYGKKGDPPTTYYMIATSDADPTAKARFPVRIPWEAVKTLEFTITGDLNSYTITVTVTEKDPDKNVWVRWEGGGSSQQVPPSNKLSHTYPHLPDPTQYVVTVYYEDLSESYPTTIIIPFQGIGG